MKKPISELEPELITLFWGIKALRDVSHEDARKAGWYQDPKTGELITRNVGEMLALIHSEISEALEGHRKYLADSHLPDYASITVELADALIRIGDLAGHLQLPLAHAVVDKLLYNRERADHKLAARAAPGGKSY